MGLPGWRFAFVVMAGLSCLIAFLVFQYVEDPRNVSKDLDKSKVFEKEDLIEKSSTSTAAVWVESCTAMKAVMKVKTFHVIVLQGVVGSVPWTTMAFYTLCLELIGKLYSHDSDS